MIRFAKDETIDKTGLELLGRRVLPQGAWVNGTFVPVVN
jgi:hypothetical protein